MEANNAAPEIKNRAHTPPLFSDEDSPITDVKAPSEVPTPASPAPIATEEDVPPEPDNDEEIVSEQKSPTKDASTEINGDRDSPSPTESLTDSIYFRFYERGCNCESEFGYDSDGDIRHYNPSCRF